MSYRAIEDSWRHAILMVTEDPGNARAVRERLELDRRGGFEIAVVPRLENAIEALRRRAWDLLLVDLPLRREPGLETLLRAQALACRLAIVVMSDAVEEEVGSRAIEAGIQEYVVADGQLPADLGRRLRHAIIRHRAMTELRRSGTAGAARAACDLATGLASRNSFLRKLRDVLALAERFRERPALLVLAPSDFGAVRDRLGPVLGACLLEELGRRLLWCVRRSDFLGRLGEDEFAVLLPHVASHLGVRMVAERIRLTLATPFETGALRTRLRASLGAAWYPQDGASVEALLRTAEAALAEARAAGGNRYQLSCGVDPALWPEELVPVAPLSEPALDGPPRGPFPLESIHERDHPRAAEGREIR